MIHKLNLTTTKRFFICIKMLPLLTKKSLKYFIFQRKISNTTVHCTLRWFCLTWGLLYNTGARWCCPTRGRSRTRAPSRARVVDHSFIRTLRPPPHSKEHSKRKLTPDNRGWSHYIFNVPNPCSSGLTCVWINNLFANSTVAQKHLLFICTRLVSYSGRKLDPAFNRHQLHLILGLKVKNIKKHCWTMSQCWLLGKGHKRYTDTF